MGLLVVAAEERARAGEDLSALAQRIAEIRASRDHSAALRALDALERGARGRDNLVPLIIDAVDASVTLGEICQRLRSVFGTHQPSVTF